MNVQPQKPDLSQVDLSDVVWKVSSYSGGGGDCVKVGRIDDWYLVGDTKCPDRLPLVFAVSQVQALIQNAKDGVFDPAAGLA
ncbi:DUF397 domain-containing protein [Streptomyces sp. SAI-090]|uniref:DUF397 domain-containing protein n=1 Tax=Streptomyces sp. SAI-090 TaxID=2940545 RepID=UPI0024750B1C|nr:DUF397 domain-containing protein [Streptomyces sp. SAI-090]MDH6522377.1 hypothetical protein [Streptomyces sp. SAI-090]